MPHLACQKPAIVPITDVLKVPARCDSRINSGIVGCLSSAQHMSWQCKLYAAIELLLALILVRDRALVAVSRGVEDGKVLGHVNGNSGSGLSAVSGYRDHLRHLLQKAQMVSARRHRDRLDPVWDATVPCREVLRR